MRILGPVEVWSADGPVPLGGARASKLLAAIALDADRAVPLERLVDVLWDDDPPATATRQARNLAAALRRRLGAGTVVTDGPGYRLRSSALPVDAQRFAAHRAEADAAVSTGDPGKAVECLRAALGLWRGPALAGAGSRVLAAAAVELDELRLRTVEQCLELELGLGRHAAVIGELSTVVAEHPLRERFTALLMLALYRSGRAGDALAAYRGLRARLATELGIDPGRELIRLHEAVLSADPALDLPSAAPVPRQLPAGTTPFVGRAGYLAALDALWPPESGSTSVVIAAIDGPPGVGKTALAVHFAHRVADQFPDGQLHLDLRGFDAAAPPLPAEAALGALLRSLGTDPGRIPTDPGEQAAHYRTLLAGRRFLVLLDNAASSEQVRPLLPGSPTSLVVITSRNHLSGLAIRHGALRVTLELLSHKESLELLGRTAGAGRVSADPAAADELVDLAGRLPLALRIIGERAGRQPLAAVAADLRSEHDRLGALHTDDASLRTVLSSSYRQLGPATARVFRLLGLHPGQHIDLAAAAALTGLSTSDTRTRLAALVDANLLTEPASGRFGWHDLLHHYAAELAESDPDRPAALRRLLDFYLHTARSAHLVLRRLSVEQPIAPPTAGVRPLTFDSHHAAVDWCESERDTLVAVVRSAAATGFAVHAWQLPWLLWEFYYLRKHTADWIATHETGLAAAVALGDRFGESRMLSGLGSAYGDRGDYPTALAYHTRLLTLTEETGDQYAKAIALHNIGVAQRKLGHPAAALGYFQRVLAAEQGLGERNGEGLVLANIAECHRALGEVDAALDHFQAALAIHRSAGEPRGEAVALHGIAECHRTLGHHDAALTDFAAALTLRRATGDQWGAATTLNAMGHTQLDAGNPVRARELWQESFALFSELGDPASDEVRAGLAGLRQDA